MEPRNLQIGGIFGKDSQRLVVPLYQRTYEWTFEAQIGRLFDFVKAKAEARLSGEPQQFAHYMGALLLIPRSDFVFGQVQIVDIVDGQQRLTTFQIMLAALQDLAKSIKLDAIANQIRPMLVNLDDSAMSDRRNERYKLDPTRYDRQLFRDLIDHPSATLQSKYHEFFYGNGGIKSKRAPKPLNAYWKLREEANAFITADEDASEKRLRALVQALLEDLRLIVVTLNKDDDAQVIFETLNSGGEPLAAMDLVRNDVFHRAVKNNEDPEDLLDARWSAFEKPFWKEVSTQGRIKKPRIDFFLAHTLGAETGKEIQMSELYAAYKQFAREQNFPSVDVELETLQKHAPTYEALCREDGVGALGRLAKALGVFEVSTAFPLVFTVAASDADESEKAAMYRLIEAYVIRRALCALAPKNFNKTFVALSAVIREKGAAAGVLGDAFADLRGDSMRFPPDDELRKAIRSNRQYNWIAQPRLRYILAELEFASRDKYDEATGLVTDLQIEHILPDVWPQHWPLQDGSFAPSDKKFNITDAQRELIERRDQAKHTLGNLTLLTQPANIEVLNYAFNPSKKERLRASLLRMNQNVAAEPQWDEYAITRRAEVLAELAIQIWPTCSLASPNH